MIKDVSKVKKGDFLSETTYYEVTGKSYDTVIVRVLGQGGNLSIGNSVVEQHLHSANLFDSEVEVTKADKRDGTLGIRSLFLEHGADICTVYFYKQDSVKKKGILKAEREAQIESAIALVKKARNGKRNMLDVAAEEFAKFQENPILEIVPGELRKMIGYKLAQDSKDGRYMFLDVEIMQPRPVNVNTIVAFIKNNVRYYVKGH